MEMLKCDVCVKSFSGLVCFQQHIASEKHKKKVQLMKGVDPELPKTVNFSDSVTNPSSFEDSMNQPHCSVCNISFPGWDSYQKHVNSLDHAIMIQKKSNDLLNPIPSNSFHSNTVQSQLTESAASFSSPSKPTDFFTECKPCQKQFSGPEPYQQHLESAGHKKKCRLSTATLQNEIDSIVKKDNINDNLPHDPKPSESGCIGSETVSQPFAKCDTCEMQFNEALSYHLHLVSDSHKMKICNNLQENSFTTTQSAFKCDICNMTFSGPIPYEQHLFSNGHKKKELAAGLSRTLAERGALILPSDTAVKDSYTSHEQSIAANRQWYCYICKKQCSGPIPYNTHIVGKDHSKNVKIKEIEENLQKIKVLQPLPFVENNTIESDLANQVTSTVNMDLNYKSELEESSIKSMINDLNRNIKSGPNVLSDNYQLNSNDLITFPSLNIIPPEKLDITVFQPMDEIVFSNPKKCIQE